MNRKFAKSRNGGRGGKSKTRRKRSSKERWLSELERNFGVYKQVNSKDQKQMVIIYNTQIPPRMPAPGGPTKGASMTTTMFVRGIDMTLQNGLVGALLRQNTSSDVFVSLAFCLADIANLSSLSALFDQYRIDEIQLRFRSRNPGVFLANQASPNYSSVSPLLVIDRDDATLPTTLLELQQFDNCQQFSAQDSIDVIFEPSITPSVFSGGAFSGYSVDDSGKYWLDVANTSIPHYGVKLGLPALVSTTTQRFDWDVEAVYKVSFLNVR